MSESMHGGSSYFKRTMAAGLLALSISSLSLEADTAISSTADCMNSLTTVGAPDEWDASAQDFCRAYGRLATMPFKENESPMLTMEEADIPDGTQELANELIAPLRPFSANPDFDMRVTASNYNVEFGLIWGSVEKDYSFIGIQGGDPLTSVDGGENLRWITFHEAAHTIPLDDQFSEEIANFREVAIAQNPAYFERGVHDTGHPILDVDEACPLNYSDTLYGLFDESSYVADSQCSSGHPYEPDDGGEFMASALTTMNQYTDRFIERFEAMHPGNQQIAGKAIESVTGQLTRINPNKADLDALVPPAIQELIAA